ncbi:MAG TPA: hypothetical protein VGM07_20870 [Stellaceae bacterium]|jgi:hypothetical protein
MRVRRGAGCAAASLCLLCTAQLAAARSAERQPAVKNAAAPTAPAPRAPTDAVGALQPVLHAQQAKITTCMDTVVRQSAAAIDGPHEAISSWTSGAPNQNLFVSIVGLSYKSPVAPNGAAVMLAAPVGPRKCEGAVVQIVPSARACSVIQASLVKAGRTIAMLRGLAIVQTNLGVRDILMPTVGGGCTLVAVGVEE